MTVKNVPPEAQDRRVRHGSDYKGLSRMGRAMNVTNCSREYTAL
ncbi:MAG TPA: hypothetical protein VLA49_07915 [Anaerolineales bacterium]|nr:hypothetical protein [Anaerolineales bacterium]